VVAGHPSDGVNMKTSKFALEGLVSLVIKGSLVFWVPPYMLICFSIFVLIFLQFFLGLA
jgi:hypothetical protein